MKPNKTFLQKVADGKVYPWSSYSARSGRYDGFQGGEATAKKHADAGYVIIHNCPGVMQRGSVELTVAGRAALATP